MPKHSIVSLMTMLMIPQAAVAHDSWVLARPSVAAPGEPVRIVFATGETFPTSEHGTDPARVERWMMGRGDSGRPIEGFTVAGDELAAAFRAAERGLWIASVALRPRFIEIEGEKFEEYLRDEQATRAIHLRRESGAATAPGREYYTKAGKAFLCVGESAADCVAQGDGFDRPVGHVLEIVPLTNPFSWRVGDAIGVRVLRDGKPVRGVRVSGGHEGLPEHTYVQHVVTDEQGEARFTLSRGGLWFLRAHVIDALRPAARRGGDDAPEADWESFWASITFEVERHGEYGE